MNTKRHKPKHHDIMCEWCHEDFRTNLPQAAFCSNKCRQAAYRARNYRRLNPDGRQPGRPRRTMPESRNGLTS